MAVAHDVKALFDKLSHLSVGLEASPPALPLPDWPELAAALPDGAFPRGVIELTSSRALGGATSVALAAVRAGQSRGKDAWCAWVDAEGSLYAPGVFAAGVDLGRLLVVRPDRAQLGRVAVKTVSSGAFEVVVVDVDLIRNPELFVRKLALAAEPCGTTVLLITDASRPRAAPWPVALRLELSRPDARSLSVRVTKEKRGRAGPDSLARTVPFLPVNSSRACFP
jgi:recombination protein RecA